MANETKRSQGLLVMLGVFVPLTVVASAASQNRLFTALAMTIGFAVLTVIVMALWDYRPSWFAGWAAGPLKELDREERQLVTRAVRSGAALADPRLARVASLAAGRTVRAMWLAIGAAGLNVALRVGLLLGTRNGVAFAFGVLIAGVSLALLAYAGHLLGKARRAEAANLVRSSSGTDADDQRNNTSAP